MEATQAQQSVTTAKAAAQATEYVVLQSANPESKQWAEVGRGKGVTAQAAVKSVIGDREGTFIAVPVRSWKPMTRRIENKPRDLWS